MTLRSQKKRDGALCDISEIPKQLNYILEKFILYERGRAQNLSPKTNVYKCTYKINLIDDKLYLAALMRDTAIFDIMDALGNFAGSVI